MPTAAVEPARAERDTRVRRHVVARRPAPRLLVGGADGTAALYVVDADGTHRRIGADLSLLVDVRFPAVGVVARRLADRLRDVRRRPVCRRRRRLGGPPHQRHPAAQQPGLLARRVHDRGVQPGRGRSRRLRARARRDRPDPRLVTAAGRLRRAAASVVTGRAPRVPDDLGHRRHARHRRRDARSGRLDRADGRRRTGVGRLAALVERWPHDRVRAQPAGHDRGRRVRRRRGGLAGAAPDRPRPRHLGARLLHPRRQRRRHPRRGAQHPRRRDGRSPPARHPDDGRPGRQDRGARASAGSPPARCSASRRSQGSIQAGGGVSGRPPARRRSASSIAQIASGRR